MLARGHKLRLGQGIVGNVARSGRPRTAFDVGSDSVFFSNPDLLETRSEMALPLKIKERVIGVLDVQSVHPAAFSDEDLGILQILADQIALAIENTRLLAQSQQALAELQSVYRQRTRQDWIEYSSAETKAYSFDRVRVKPVKKVQTNGQNGNQTGDAKITSDPDGHHLVVPISVRGEHLGALTFQRKPDEPPWTKEDLDLANETTRQVAIAIENARLLEDARQRAERERAISEISARITQNTNIENILQAAVQEISRLPKVTDVTVQIQPSQKK